MIPSYHDYFKIYINKGIELELLDPKLKTFDLDRLASTLDPTRDMQFTYLGLQTLYDRYFIHYKYTALNCRKPFLCVLRWDLL